MHSTVYHICLSFSLISFDARIAMANGELASYHSHWEEDTGIGSVVWYRVVAICFPLSFFTPYLPPSCVFVYPSAIEISHSRQDETRTLFPLRIGVCPSLKTQWGRLVVRTYIRLLRSSPFYLYWGLHSRNTTVTTTTRVIMYLVLSQASMYLNYQHTISLSSLENSLNMPTPIPVGARHWSPR